MVDMDIEKLIEAVSSDKIGKNANTIMGVLKETNIVLAEVQKTTTFLKQIGILPLLVRGIGKKMNIDVDKPLTDNGIQPKSEAHGALINAINQMTNEQLIEFSRVLQNAGNKTNAENTGQAANK